MALEENLNGSIVSYHFRNSTVSETHTASTILIIAVSAIIFILGAFGNVTVCIGFLRYRSLRTKTNILLLNLAISDLVVVSFNVPLNAAVFISRFYYHFGPIMCKIQYFIHSTVIGVVTLTLVTVSFDRYRKIVCAPRKIGFTRNQISYIILGIWILSICLNAVQIRILELIPASEAVDKFYCIEVWPFPNHINRRAYSIALFIALCKNKLSKDNSIGGNSHFIILSLSPRPSRFSMATLI
ncbi:Neuropeptide FF receptor 2 [Trichoplax sp. H2]|nr:Neuropeptide FF receptor 2 [Trichoplax sp. H2]|eukprot:RDD44389.1 Neuropeptide FF receptor 2 [Trichoplax sp. H2]